MRRVALPSIVGPRLILSTDNNRFSVFLVADALSLVALELSISKDNWPL